ncbi:hypothetical protein F5Y05DRAFT_414311 [Hypoxylon sp. FL0543]|nr:hypothetical protein F5Y05DRAFT_414311 [Hypoxylon sp. FL0543]
MQQGFLVKDAVLKADANKADANTALIENATPPPAEDVSFIHIATLFRNFYWPLFTYTSREHQTCTMLPSVQTTMNPTNQQPQEGTLAPKGYTAPPSLPGQIQPWRQWYTSESLDTDEEMEEDKELQHRRGFTQTTT